MTSFATAYIPLGAWNTVIGIAIGLWKRLPRRQALN